MEQGELAGIDSISRSSCASVPAQMYAPIDFREQALSNRFRGGDTIFPDAPGRPSEGGEAHRTARHRCDRTYATRESGCTIPVAIATCI